jgi:MscS family membrane protein
MLETFFFANCGYDLAPELIVNAIDCLDYSGIGRGVSERDAAVMAHDLNAIATRQDIALYAVPDGKNLECDSYVLIDRDSIRLVLEKQSDGRWRFSSETVRRIGTMRIESFRRQREVQESRMKLAEGRTDPESTMRTFLADAARRDFAGAARCLDLRDVPLKLRSVRGPELARKLAFVIQRCGFVFPQEIVSDPDGWRYIWHSNRSGRIMLDRVRQHDGKDAWLFSRGTLHNLDALVEHFRHSPPDQRYAFVGVLIDASSLSEAAKQPAPPPPGVPREIASARATMGTFLEAMDDPEIDEAQARTILSCLNLEEIAESDRAAAGLRLAAKLEALLLHLNIDLVGVPDSWQADPQTFAKEPDLQVTLCVQADGCWRFSSDTIARVPEMFDRLSPVEKTRGDRDSRFGSARQTIRSFLRAIACGDDHLAALALDLSLLPARARSDLGPVLARELKFVIDQIGPVHLQVIPNEVDAPHYLFYRGPLGRISLEPVDSGAQKRDWLFTADTVGHIEPMFQAALQRQAARGALISAGHADPITLSSSGILVRQILPAWLERSVMGLELYQWIGLVVNVLLAGGIAWLVLRMLDGLSRWALRRYRFQLSDPFVR